MMFTATHAIFDEISEHTAELRARILAAEDAPLTGRRCFYVAPDGDDGDDGLTPDTAWQTLSKVNAADLQPGDAVLLERGGLWRERLTAKAGVRYGAFGDGDKPKIYGSPENGAGAEKWEEVLPDIWRYRTKFAGDVGNIVFDDGARHARKVIARFADGKMTDSITGEPWEGASSLKGDLDMWHELGGDVTENPDGGWLYLRSHRGNPGARFSSVEFLTRGNIIRVAGNDVEIDNLCIKYGGCHGIGAGSVNGLTVTGCEVGWIGGSLQFYRNGRPTRFGNGVEIYGGCEDYTIERCYVYQCYDAGITHQYSAVGTEPLAHHNVRYADNLIEYCTYSVEYFMGKAENDARRVMGNVLITDNIMRFAGYGWGAQRPDVIAASHIKGWDHANRLDGPFEIEDNIFACSEYMLIHCGTADASDLPKIAGNTLLQYAGGQLGRYAANPTAMILFDDAEAIPALEGNEFYVIRES